MFKITEEMMYLMLAFGNYIYEYEILEPTKEDVERFLLLPESQNNYYGSHIEGAQQNQACEFAQWLEKRYGKINTLDFYQRMFKLFKDDQASNASGSCG